MAATLPQTQKVNKAYYAHYYDEPGAITKIAGCLYFVSDAGDVIEVEPETLTFLVVLGQMQMADAQQIADLMDGGYAGVACGRTEGCQ